MLVLFAGRGRLWVCFLRNI